MFETALAIAGPLIRLPVHFFETALAIAEPLAEYVSACASLTSLSLRDDNLGDEGVESLSIGLKESKSLKTLDLSNGFRSSTKFGPKGATALASAIAVSASLTEVLAF